MEEIIKTVDLSKKYGDVEAVKSLNIQVKRGEIYGFLGLNGAGKTTTIRMLLGMIRSVSGEAFILGRKVYANNNELWKKIGYLVETPYAYPNLTVHENLEIVRRLRFLADKKSVDEIIDKLFLTRYRNRKAGHLSLGNKQRLGLAKALIHHPEILILDEPANGLDPSGIHDIREMLTDLAVNDGVTIFISSHILDEISKIATRIGIIHMGKMVRELDTLELKTLCKKHLFIKADNTDSACAAIMKRGYTRCEIKDDVIKIGDESAIDDPGKIAGLLVKDGYPPTMLNVTGEDLESFFLRTIKGAEV